MDYPKFIVSSQKEESISIQKVKHAQFEAITWDYRPTLWHEPSFTSLLCVWDSTSMDVQARLCLGQAPSL